MSFDNNFSVTWHEEKEPPRETIYLVAVRYPNGFGAYDFAAWDGEKWDLGYTAEVVGWVNTNDIFRSLSVGWPAGDEARDAEFKGNMTYEERKELRRQSHSDDEEDNWIEI